MNALLLAIVIGAKVHWYDRTTHERFCGNVTVVDEYKQRVWILPDISPHWYAIEPISNVKPGCPDYISD